MVIIKHSIFYFVMFLMVCSVTLRSGGQYETEQKAGVAREFSWPNGKMAALSLSFDDARFSQIDVGIPILNQYNVKATFYVSIDRLEQRVDDWKKILMAGHEIGNHSLTHPCSGNFPWARHKALEEYTLEKMEQELDDANAMIEQLLNVRPKTFAYPCGQTFVGRGKNLKSYIPLVAQRFIAGRGWLDEGDNDPVFSDLTRLMAREFDGLRVEQVKVLIDQAVENGAWLILAGHDIGAPGRQVTTAATLDSLCCYVNQEESRIWVAPVQTVAEYIINRRK